MSHGACDVGLIRLQVSSLTLDGSGFRGERSGLRLQGSGLRFEASGFRVQGSGCKVQGAGCRVQGAGCRVQGGVEGRGFRVLPLAPQPEQFRLDDLFLNAAAEPLYRAGSRSMVWCWPS